MPDTTVIDWLATGALAPRSLDAARLQLHHAAQLIVSSGISYLPPAPDDSHTNLEWLPSHMALAAQPLTPETRFRFALRPTALELLVLKGENADLVDSFSLLDKTVSDADRWMKRALSRDGLDASRLSHRKHYEIPVHPVADGAAFDASADALVELSRYYHDAWLLTSRIVSETAGASEPRCWPHHFDLATLITLPGSPRRTIGVGVSPGDHYYDQPYIYIGPYPYPPADRLGALPSGHWHTDEWTGAVLTASEYVGAAGGDRALAFARAAVAACERAFA